MVKKFLGVKKPLVLTANIINSKIVAYSSMLVLDNALLFSVFPKLAASDFIIRYLLLSCLSKYSCDQPRFFLAAFFHEAADRQDSNDYRSDNDVRYPWHKAHVK